jgi:hypothetical protein
MVTELPTDEEDNGLRYSIRLLIKHPSIDPDRITETLGLAPHLSAIAGSERTTPTGTVLPGPHKVSVWSHSFDVKGKRRFFSDVDAMIDRLEPHKALLSAIADGGGNVMLIVHLPGDVNIGSTLRWREMARLANLHVDLGIEVFPEFN